MCSYSHRSLAILLLLLISVGVSGCGVVLAPLSRLKAKNNNSRAIDHHAITDPIAPSRPIVPDLEADASKDLGAYEKYSAQIRVYLDQEKFDEIDAIADTVRAGKTRFSGGAWKLQKLYRGLREPSNGRKASEAVWQLHIGRLTKWVERKPESITARVGLADAYTEYAWHARGTGFADTVTEEGWKLMADRVATAKTVLEEAKQLKAKCPHWYEVMQTVALGQSWEMDEYNKVFEEAVAFEPAYHYFYGDKAQYLLPRWHGEPGDWEHFADDISRRLGGKLGSIMYFEIAMDVSDCYKDRTFFTETKISWPKLKQGFADLEETHGVSIRLLNEFCRIAGQSGEKAYTKALLTRIGDNWDPETWTNKEYFEHYKAWANSGE
jgi:hypothetical protein